MVCADGYLKLTDFGLSKENVYKLHGYPNEAGLSKIMEPEEEG